MKEFLTFGAAARIFQCLQGATRTKVALEFGVRSDDIFINWVECLVDLRNTCAHHERVFNKVFQKQPRHLRVALLPKAAPNKLKAILECLDYLMAQRGMPSQLTQSVAAHIAQYPAMSPAEAGY